MLDQLFSKLRKNVDRFRARRLISSGLFADVDWASMNRLAERHPDHSYLKYLRTKQFLVRNAARLFPLGLHRPPAQRILDLGS